MTTSTAPELDDTDLDTDEPDEIDDDIPSITTAGAREVGEDDQKPFRIDGVTFHLLRPKAVVLGNVAALIDPTRPWTAQENSKVLLQYVGNLIDYVKVEPNDEDTGDARGRALLKRRLSDPDDALDLHDLVPLLIGLMKGWFGSRPTGSRPASGGPRKGSRKGGSRARTR